MADNKEQTEVFANIRIPRKVFEKYSKAIDEYAASNGWRRATNEQFVLYLLEMWEKKQ